MIYLWSLDKHRVVKIVTDTVLTCLLNMNLRRQHEVEVGKDYIERAKEAGATYENDNETDKVNYTRFCQGLERLDIASLHRWAADGNVFEEHHSHGVRQLVTAPELLATME